MHTLEHAVAVAGPIVVTQVVKMIAPYVPVWKRKLPTWTLPLLAIAVGVAQAWAPWLGDADVLTTGLLGASAVGLVESGQRLGRVGREAWRRRKGRGDPGDPDAPVPAS